MNRRDFLLKSAIISSGLLGTGMLQSMRHTRDGDPNSGHGKRHFTIDSFSHWSSLEVLNVLEGGVSIPGFQHVFRKLFANNPQLINVDARLELMEKMNVDRHVLVPLPWIESIPTPYITKALSLEAAQTLNNQMAQLVKDYPDKFSAVALLPLLDREDMLMEFERCVKELGMVGGLYVCGHLTKPPDHPDFFDPAPDPFPEPFQKNGEHFGEDTLYGKAVALDVPLWLHPAKPPVLGDYAGEDSPEGPGSMFNIFQALSWLLDSSVAMVRIVFAGVFKKYPGLKIVVHHHGALIPSYAERLVYGWDFFEQNNGVPTSEIIKKPFIDHFKKFYCDTATQGVSPDLLKRAIDFFGADHVLFGTDAPMDATGGEIFTETACNSLDFLNLNNKVSEMIYSGNAAELIGVKVNV